MKPKALLIAVVLVFACPTARSEVGIDEKLGEMLPLEGVFKDEDGKDVKLKELFDQPVVLALVYYRCPSICNVLLAGLSDVVEKMALVPGKDFRIVTISFNPDETPDVAKRKKENYLKRMERKIDPSSWHFLTGSAEAIRVVTEATGFKYKRTGKEYQHPATLIVLAPDGKVARYLYGVKFNPFDLKMAIYEASRGRTGPTINKLLLYCFSYDPEGKTYVFNTLKVTASVTLVFLVFFVVFLVITTRRRRKMQPAESEPHE